MARHFSDLPSLDDPMVGSVTDETMPAAPVSIPRGRRVGVAPEPPDPPAPQRQTVEIPTYEQPDGKPRVDATGHVTLPYGQAASYRYSYPTAVATDDYYEVGYGDVPARGGIRKLGRGICMLLAWAVRLIAFATFMLVLLNVLQIWPIRPYLTYVTDLVTNQLPWHRLGVLGVDTPFGGTFRGDLAIVTALLFMLDWGLCRLRAAMR